MRVSTPSVQASPPNCTMRNGGCSMRGMWQPRGIAIQT
jgi:hypothetical protein